MHTRAAFTLIELALALVVVGLLVGGVLMGQEVLRAAQLRSVGVHSQQYLAAIREFRNQYQALPGDFTGATRLWGTGTCPSGNALKEGSRTCDGNGDSAINLWNEMYRAWQHLSNAGLITGNFTGTHLEVAGRGVGEPGVNIPAERLRGGGWSLVVLTPSITYNEFGYSDLPLTYFNFLLLGRSSTTEYANGAIVPARDAEQIDLKLDDGKPGTGMLLGGPGANVNVCANTAISTTAAYSVARNPLCRLGFKVDRKILY